MAIDPNLSEALQVSRFEHFTEIFNTCVIPANSGGPLGLNVGWQGFPDGACVFPGHVRTSEVVVDTIGRVQTRANPFEALR